MMRRVKNAKALVVLVFFTVACTATFGQVATPSKPAKKDVPVKHVPVIQPEKVGPAAVKVADTVFKRFNLAAIQSDNLDLAVTRLPLETLAIEVKKVVDQPGKGEFESTADYEARKKAALSISFLGGSTVNDTFATAMPVTNRRRDIFEYAFNPDTGDGALFVLPEYISGGAKGWSKPQVYGRESGLDFLGNLDTKTLSESTYEASNGYGEKMTVKKVARVHYGLAATRIPLAFERELSYSEDDFKPTSKIAAVRFKLDSATAAKVIPQLKALVVFNLRDPFIIEDAYHFEPKRENPTERLGSLQYLRVLVLGVIWYSSASGEIFARFPESFGSPVHASVQETSSADVSGSREKPRGN
jgi:hypothetical protein